MDAILNYQWKTMGTLYFDITPYDIKKELILYLPRACLLSRIMVRKCVDLVDIFSLPAFAMCDNETIWKKLYKKDYSEEDINTKYKDEYISVTVENIKNTANYLKFATSRGLDKILKVFMEDGFWYDYYDLFTIAVKNRQLSTVKLFCKGLCLRKEHFTEALESLLDNSLTWSDKGLLTLNNTESLIELLVKNGAQFPKVHFDRYCKISHYTLNYLFGHECLKDVIQLLLKFDAITEHEKFICALVDADVSIDITIWYTDFILSNVIKSESITKIVKDIFKKIRHVDSWVLLDKLIQHGYQVTEDDIKYSIYNKSYTQLLDVYVKQKNCSHIVKTDIDNNCIKKQKLED